MKEERGEGVGYGKLDPISEITPAWYRLANYVEFHLQKNIAVAANFMETFISLSLLQTAPPSLSRSLPLLFCVVL